MTVEETTLKVVIEYKKKRFILFSQSAIYTTTTKARTAFEARELAKKEFYEKIGNQKIIKVRLIPIDFPTPGSESAS